MYYNTDSTKYFSWGDIIGQNKNGSGSYSFSEDNYNAGVCGSGHTLRDGDIPQGNATYDAARANMGSPWKMFTQAQGQELIDGTNSTWTTINGVNGRKFTSKTDSSKYIFLPAGGVWNETNNNWIGSEGNFWTTMLGGLSQPFWMCSSSYVLDLRAGNIRLYGYSVRAT